MELAVLVFLLCPSVVLPCAPAPAQGGCQPSWVPTFGAPGLNEAGAAAAVYDDGGGPALFVGGAFTRAGGIGADRIARWNGTAWSAPEGALDWEVRALVVHDDGGGPALFAGGVFTTAGGLDVDRIARWNGTSWSALAGGVEHYFGVDPSVEALAVFDDGSGSALYAAGIFRSAGGQPRNNIAKWNGTSWSPLGSGIDDPHPAIPSVHALAVFDDGSGPALYAGGGFARAGGQPRSNLARWDGTSWSGLGSGTNGSVRALTVFDDGSGPALFAGGSFTSAGGVAASGVARWDGTSWTALDAGTNGAVHALEVFDDGSGPALYAGGAFASAGGAAAPRIARWDGTSWTPLGAGTNGTVRDLALFDDGSGPALCVLGEFTAAGGLAANRVARWDGAWSLFDAGPDNEISGTVWALAAFDDGGAGGPALYAGGQFPTGTSLDFVRRWDGSTWSTLGSGVDSTVHELMVFDDGSGGGPSLFVGGDFTSAGGAPASRIARFDGTSWSTLGSGMTGGQFGTGVYALAVFDDQSGAGPALHAGGNFASAGGTTAPGVARWDGLAWSPLRLGLFGEVHALAVFDDGSGPALYAGGGFQQTGGGAAMNYIARWDGVRWSPLGAGMNGWVFALEVYDDGGGPALYAGGWFTSAGGVPANCVAKWDGTGWSSLGGGLQGSVVYALATFDDGGGEELHAGGYFDLTGGPGPGSYFARWDGTSWSPVGGGVEGGVHALTTFDHPWGRALYAGGGFTRAYDSLDRTLARWQGCLDVVPPALHCPASVLVHEQPGSPPGESVSFSVTASDEVDLAPTIVCVPPSGSFFPRGRTTVVCTATDAAGNQATCEFRVTVANKLR